jgi:hypothetical protein
MTSEEARERIRQAFIRYESRRQGVGSRDGANRFENGRAGVGPRHRPVTGQRREQG